MIGGYHSPLFGDVLWAKKSDRQGVFQWLPLKQHLFDTSMVMQLLWEHWLSLRQKREIINSLSQPSEELAKNLVGFLGAIHDLGKATPIFQSKPSFTSSRDLDNELLEKLESSGFTDITEYYSRIMDPSATPHAIAGQILLESYGVLSDISSIVGAHHGKPPDNRSDLDSQLSSYTNNYFQEQNKDNPVHRRWVETQQMIFNLALTTNGFASVDELPRIKQPGQVLLSGLLIMADWIASNESYFPLIDLDTTMVDDMEQRIVSGWLKWYRTVPRIEDDHRDSISGYKERFNFEPRDLQVKFYEVVQQTNDPGVFIIEAPMGVGKTEAALMAVEQLSAKTKASGMFYGLPTQATSDGMFDRISAWLDSLDDEKKSLQLVHGKAALNESFSSLPRSQINDEADGSVIVNEWFVGRKTAVLDDFVVGTVDQFLMTALKQKHLALRHLGFSRKVVVIDEVHAYDAYMSQYLYRALQWMGAYKVPVIILSATLPASTRIELIKHYMRGRGIKWRDVKQPEGWDTTTAYPLVTYTDGSTVKQFSGFNSENYARVAIVRIDDNDLISTLSEYLQDGGIAGVIVNTVRRAQEIAELCSQHFGEDIVELLHSNFIAADRVKKELKLLQTIGKDSVRPYKKIIVGTQVMEQSLDIDFDLLVTDLAPMDLLIQRIGRLHRHSSVRRPEMLKEPTVFILGTSETFEFDQGSTAVYGDYLLIRTQLILPEFISLPGDISPLVQAVYSNDDFAVADILREKYVSSKNEHESSISRKQSKAVVFRLGTPSFSPNKDLIGWLDCSTPYESEEWAVAQVRDTHETIEVIALKKQGDGYTIFGETADLSVQIDDPGVQKLIARQTLRLPLILSAHYCIDQTIEALEDFNRKYLPSWQHSVWLRGLLGIIFDENNEFILNGHRLKYCQRLGLTCEKITDGEEGSD